MPIRIAAEIRRMDDKEFKARVYDVMRHAFDVQRELGRLFHEKIYHREIAFRIPDAQCEVAPDVALKITAMTTEGQAEFQSHLERLLAHADLRAVQWINITRPVVCFKTICKGKKGRW